MNVILPKNCFIFVEEKLSSMSKAESTLNGMYFSSQRAMGNTTRIVNFAIESLFKGVTIKVEDHFENGANAMANQMLCDRILRRLQQENLCDPKMIEYNRSKMTIRIK